MIPEGWEPTTLGKIVAESGGSIQTGPFGSQLHASDYVLQGIPSVMPANIGENFIIEDGIARISEDDARRLQRHRMEPGDIVYSRRGDVERRALIREDNAGWLCGTGCLRVHFGSRGENDPAFVSYQLGTEWTREWIVRHAVGATMLNLNTGILSAVPLERPPLHEQQAIAEVLGALDDKIAANTRLASTAKRLAKSVFDSTTASSSVSVALDSIANHLPGKYISREDYVLGGQYPIYGSNSEMGAASSRTAVGPFAVLARIGSSCGALRWSQGDAWVNNNASAIVPREGFPPTVLRFVLDRIDMNPFRAGSGQPFIRVKDLMGIDVEVPVRSGMVVLGSVLDSLAVSEFAHLDENRTLAATRDALLPQLMSGKLRVRDAERVVSEVA